MFSERLKQLRQEKGITQATLALQLNIAKTTLASYEQGKNEPSLQMLIKIAEYFNVSLDYLLGLSNISSTNPSLTYMGKYLGLTEESMQTLHLYQKIALEGSNKSVSQKIDTLNKLFSPDCELLEHISEYLHFSPTHFKNFYDDKKLLAPISELELWDEVEKIGFSSDHDMWSKALLLIVEEDLRVLKDSFQKERVSVPKDNKA